MNIGLLKEIKSGEGRVALTPVGVRAILTSAPNKHQIFVETGAGDLSGYSDEEYKSAGATILTTAKDVYAKSTLIIHVKEPLSPEFLLLRKDHILFTYLHLAADANLTKKLMEIGCTAFGYETLEADDHSLPLLAPMSKIAGKMAFTYAMYCSQKKTGGQGIYLGTIDKKCFGTVLIIGGGVVGTYAAENFVGIGSNVIIIEKKEERRNALRKLFPSAIILSTDDLDAQLPKADVIIGAVLIPGASAPKLIQKRHLLKMKKHAIVIDISIDQGGISEMSHSTSIENPTYFVDDIVFCCIPNIPGTIPHTSTELITDATLPYVIQLANEGLKVLKNSRSFQTSLNIYKKKCVHQSVASSTGVIFTELKSVLTEK